MKNLLIAVTILAGLATPAFAFEDGFDDSMTRNFGEAFDAPDVMTGPTVLNQQPDGSWMGVDAFGNPLVVNPYRGGGSVQTPSRPPVDTRSDCLVHALFKLPCAN